MSALRKKHSFSPILLQVWNRLSAASDCDLLPHNSAHAAAAACTSITITLIPAIVNGYCQNFRPIAKTRQWLLHIVHFRAASLLAGTLIPLCPQSAPSRRSNLPTQQKQGKEAIIVPARCAGRWYSALHQSGQLLEESVLCPSWKYPPMFAKSWLFASGMVWWKRISYRPRTLWLSG